MSRSRRSQRSQAMVEFALIAPVFFILFIALADMSRGLFAYVELSEGSRAGARQAVLQYNAGSNQTAGTGCTSPCQAPGVVPMIKKVAGWGFPVVYGPDVNSSTPPTYVATPLANDVNWTQNGSAPPYDLALTNSAATNQIYVIVYEYDPASASRSARWADATSARDPGHQVAVVDLKLKWTSITLSLLGFTPSLTLDSQTVERIEY